jgi:uncharacterized protein
MALEGVVTNVTAFGAFVDVGVHQDGLVHVSQLADRFVKDPHEVVKVGDRVAVRVLDVDLARGRISLTAKREAPKPEPAPAGAAAPAPAESRGAARHERRERGGERRERGGERRERGPRREEAPAPAPSLRPPPPKPLTPRDAQKQGRNNPLGDLLKGLFDRK